MVAAANILENLRAQVANSVTVEASAKTLIDGFAARQQAAIDQALANGATPEQLAPVQAEVDALKASSDALSASVVANTAAADVTTATTAPPVTQQTVQSPGEQQAALVQNP